MCSVGVPLLPRALVNAKTDDNKNAPDVLLQLRVMLAGELRVPMGEKPGLTLVKVERGLVVFEGAPDRAQWNGPCDRAGRFGGTPYCVRGSVASRRRRRVVQDCDVDAAGVRSRSGPGRLFAVLTPTRRRSMATPAQRERSVASAILTMAFGQGILMGVGL